MTLNHQNNILNANSIDKIVKEGDLAKIKKLDKQTLIAHGLNFLFSAAKHCRFHIAYYLIHDCKLDAKSANNNSLFIALVSGTYKTYQTHADLEKVFDLLIDANIDPKIKINNFVMSIISNDYWENDSPILYQQRLNILNKLLIKKVFNVNSVISSANEYTPLILAASEGNTEMCMLFLKFGADLTATLDATNGKRTAIAEAISHEHFKLAEELLNYAKANKLNLKAAIGPAIPYCVQDVSLLNHLITNGGDKYAANSHKQNIIMYIIENATSFLSSNNIRDLIFTLLFTRLLQDNGLIRDCIKLKIQKKVHNENHNLIVQCLNVFPYNLDKRHLITSCLATVFSIKPLIGIIDEYAIPDFEDPKQITNKINK